MGKPTLNDALSAIARSLREFGYPDASDEMIREIWDAYQAGNRNNELPHGIVGMMAGAQFNDNAEWMEKLK